MTVLYIDNDADDLEIFSLAANTLKDLDVSVVAAHGGGEALEMLSGNIDVDIIFLDINMPSGLSGFEVLRQLKNNRQLQSIPVVVYTTSNREEDKVKARKLGADRYVVKPNSFAEICRAISKTLKQDL